MGLMDNPKFIVMFVNMYKRKIIIEKLTGLFLMLLLIAVCDGCSSMYRPYYTSIGGKYIYNDFRICKLVGEDKGSVVGVKIIVDLTVHSYNYDKDKNYIIAYQIPSDSIGSPLPECYWLIDVQNDSIYGPLTLKSFMDTKRRLGVHLTFDKNIGSTTWCNELCHRVIEQDTCK